jgi:hypothetical protein
MVTLGATVIKIFMSFKLTDDLKTNPQEIRNRFRDHFVPQINRTFEQYKFNQIMQELGGNFCEYTTGLDYEAKKCSWKKV